MNKIKFCAFGCCAIVALATIGLSIENEPNQSLIETENPIRAKMIMGDSGHLPGDDVEASGYASIEAYEAEANENELIEDALVEDGYYRDDIPLTYEDQDYLQTACDEFGVDYALMLGLIEKETGFCNSVGDNGDSEGYCQIQSYWWGDLMAEIGAKDLMVSFDNFRTACCILSRFMVGYDLTNSLTLYNSGSTGNSEYARDVIENMNAWEEVLNG